MKLTRIIIFVTFFFVVLSKISKEQYDKLLEYRKKMIAMNSSGDLNEQMEKNYILLEEKIAEYEMQNSLEDETTTQTSEIDVINPSFCKLYLHNKSSNKENNVEKLLNEKYIHMFKYKIIIDDKNNSEVDSNLSQSFGLDTWYHAFTNQGKSLLSLRSDLNLKSFTLLTSGVEEMTIKVVESELNCFVKLQHDDRKIKLLMFLEKHFSIKKNKNFILKETFCYQKLNITYSKGKFVYECCSSKDDCEIVSNLYIDIFKHFLLAIKIIFLLICPIVIQKLFFTKNIGKFNYTIPIPKPGLKKTMLIKRVNSDYETLHRSSKHLSGNKEMQQFSNFRKLVKSIPSDEIISVNFSLLDVSVDHADLISKDESPIHFLQYIYSTLIHCQCGRSHPFRTCYGESIIGSWSPNFLWCRLKKKCETNNSFRECLSWFAIFRFISTILLIILLPLPFYLKVLYYHFYEKEVFDKRQSELNNLGIKENIYDILLKGVYKYICYLGLFLSYFLSALVFVILRALFPSQISMIIKQCVKDFKNINRFECFRMIMSHIILPFEKFGIFGPVVGVFYWPVVIPISLILTIIYCIPLLYIIGRVFILERPQCIEGTNGTHTNLRTQGSHSISRNVTSIANCFFLDHISPKNKIIESNDTHEKPLKKTKLLFCCSFDKTKFLSFIKNIIIGVIFITLLLSLCVMYTEAFGFIVEIVFLTILGAFLNGNEVLLHIVFSLLVIFYIILYLHYIKWKYSSFSYKLFDAVKAKLNKDIIEKFVRCREIRECTAFKYFAPEELRDKAFKLYPQFGDVRLRSELERFRDLHDNIEYISGKLHWTLNSLVVFIDGNDVVRMPRDLYWRICNLDIPSSPGPIWKTFFLSTIKLFSTFIYLGLLLLIVFFYSDTQSELTKLLEKEEYVRTSSIGLRALFLILLGLIPAVVYILLLFSKCYKETPMIGENIAWIIKSYRRSWPVSDLVFENPESPITNARGSLESAKGDDSRNEMPLKVDLLITLKDEPVYDPNRISMASNGSIQSLTSFNKLSPEEQKIPEISYAPSGKITHPMQRHLLEKTDGSTNAFAGEFELKETHKT